MNGVYAAIVTHFDSDLEVDHDAVVAQVHRLIDGGIHGIVPNGTVGEGGSLSRDERREVTETVVGASAGRVPVCVGVSASTADQAAAYARDAEAAGRRQRDDAAATAVSRRPPRADRVLHRGRRRRRPAGDDLQQPHGQRLGSRAGAPGRDRSRDPLRRRAQGVLRRRQADRRARQPVPRRRRDGRRRRLGARGILRRSRRVDLRRRRRAAGAERAALGPVRGGRSRRRAPRCTPSCCR